MSPEQYNMRTKVEKIKEFSKSVKNHIEHNKNIDKTLKSSLTQNIKKIEGSIRNCNIDNYNTNKENVKELEKQVNTMIESKEYGEYLKNEQDKNHSIELNELMSKQKEIETLIQPIIKEDLVIEKYKNVETNTSDNMIQNSLELESSNVVKNNIKNNDLDESEILETQIKPTNELKNRNNQTNNTKKEENSNNLPTANSKHDRVNKPKQQKSTKLNMFDNMFNNKFGTRDNNITQMFMIASLMRMNPFIFFMLYNNLRNKEIFKSMTNIATSLDTGERNIQK